MEKIIINTREELDNLLKNYPSGSPIVVIDKNVCLAGSFYENNCENIDVSN